MLGIPELRIFSLRFYEFLPVKVLITPHLCILINNYVAGDEKTSFI